MDPNLITEKQAYDACKLVHDIAINLERRGFSVNKPQVPGIFRYGVYAPENKAYWLMSTWKDYFSQDDNPLYLYQERYLGDFVIEFDGAKGAPQVRWRLTSPVDETGAINTSHCETLRQLAMALNTSVNRILSDKAFVYTPYPF